MDASIIATEHHNFKTATGEIAEGCKRCVRGEKLVVFVTGVCGNGCPYCPVSDLKNAHDVIFANEAPVKDDEDLLKESEIMDATGAGITGGDPLAVLSRTERYIRLLKDRYGKGFHIHLYTPLLRVNESSLKRLHDAGLDEIRFHPKLDDKSLWPRLRLARSFDWQVGVEVPVLPAQEEGIRDLLDFIAKGHLVDFVNLNEFEYADNEVFERAGVHYDPKDASSYAVKGSADAAKRLLSHAQGLGIPAHFCTAKSKDAVQLARRLQRRAKGAAKAFDAVDEEGLLTRGAIYCGLSIVDEGYGQKLLILPGDERERLLGELRSLKSMLMDEWDVPEELLFIDEPRLRLLTTTSVAEAVADELDFTVALVKEYPTDDCFLVEAEVLRKRS